MQGESKATSSNPLGYTKSICRRYCSPGLPPGLCLLENIPHLDGLPYRIMPASYAKYIPDLVHIAALLCLQSFCLRYLVDCVAGKLHQRDPSIVRQLDRKNVVCARISVQREDNTTKHGEEISSPPHPAHLFCVCEPYLLHCGRAESLVEGSTLQPFMYI